jgi:hypothetical protein
MTYKTFYYPYRNFVEISADGLVIAVMGQELASLMSLKTVLSVILLEWGLLL